MMLVAPQRQISFQAVTSNFPTSTVGSGSCVIPSPVLPGDILIACAANCWATRYVTPSGWTLLATDTNTGSDTGSSSPDIGIGFFYRVASGTEAGTTLTVTQTTSGNSSQQMGILRYTAAAPTAVTVATTRSGTTASKTSPAPTAFSGNLPNDLCIRVWAAANHTSQQVTTMSFSPPSGWTSRYGGVSSGSANYVNGMVIGERVAATDTSTVTNTGSYTLTWVTAGCRLSVLSSGVVIEQNYSLVQMRAQW